MTRRAHLVLRAINGAAVLLIGVAAAEWARTARLGLAGAAVGTMLAFAWDHGGTVAIVVDLFRWWFVA